MMAKYQEGKIVCLGVISCEGLEACDFSRMLVHDEVGSPILGSLEAVEMFMDV